MFSSYLGKIYGQIGVGLPVAVSLVAIAMGLNLLEVMPVRLPSLDVDVRAFAAPPLLQVGGLLAAADLPTTYGQHLLNEPLSTGHVYVYSD